MKVETLSFQEILKHTPDIFEAVVVAGQRARQIVNRRAAEQMEFLEDYPDEDFPIVETVNEEDYVEEEKASPLAMDDFLSNRLEWRYVDSESDEAEERPEQ